MADLETFRLETREWLEANCPPSMRTPVRGFEDIYTGGRRPEVAIADQLAELGVPKQDIVLAYHSPMMRQYTEFAVG